MRACSQLFALLTAAALVAAPLCLAAPCTGYPNTVTNSNGWNVTLPAAPGTVAGARCNAGYRSNPPAAATCLSNGTWTKPGLCQSACSTLPPAEWLQNGNWSAECIGTPFGSRCTGTCWDSATTGVPFMSYTGSPSIACSGGGAWLNTTMVGACVVDPGVPVCTGPPPTPKNARVPASCIGRIYDNCVAICNPGYGTNQRAPVSRGCDFDDPRGPTWLPWEPAFCYTGSAPPPCTTLPRYPIMVSYDPSEFNFTVPAPSGTVAVAACHDYDGVTGTGMTATCDRGTWIFSDAGCQIELPCMTPPNNFVITPPAGTASNVTFTCPPSSSPPYAPGTSCIAYFPCDDAPGAVGHLVETCTRGAWKLADMNCTSCFAGDDLVNVEGQATPVAMRDVQVGMKVECIGISSNLRQPLGKEWCEVMAWVHADSGVKPHVRLTYPLPDGSNGSILVSPNHLVAVTSAAPGATAPSLSALGAHSLVAAASVRVGSTIAVSDASGGFTAARITAAAQVQSQGYYLPAIRSPYLIVNSLATPLWITHGLVPDSAPAWQKAAVLHVLAAPLWMAHSPQQPIGTTGREGTWNGDTRWPGVAQLNALALAAIAEGRHIDLDVLFSLFLPRYQAWLANNAAVVTLDEMMAAVRAAFVA